MVKKEKSKKIALRHIAIFSNVSLLTFLFLVEKKERVFAKPSQIYLWLSQKLSHQMAELQENPSIVIQSSSISSNTLFTDTTGERARNHSTLEMTMSIAGRGVCSVPFQGCVPRGGYPPLGARQWGGSQV